MPRRLGSRLARLLLVLLASYYLYRAVRFRFLTPDQLGPDLLHKQLWYVGHLLAALAVFVGGPLQFSPTLRARRPALHRLIGRLYIGGATLASLTAIYLGATIEYEGSRLPIVLLGVLWLFFTLAAWRCALDGNMAAHRLFMIRSYGLALVLVWLRLAARRWGGTPPIEPAPTSGQARLAALAHGLLYGLMIALPLLGWLTLSAKAEEIPFFLLQLPALVEKSQAGAKWFKEFHEAGATIGYLLVGLHAAAALYHHYRIGDNTLARILPATPRKR